MEGNAEELYVNAIRHGLTPIWFHVVKNLRNVRYCPIGPQCYRPAERDVSYNMLLSLEEFKCYLHMN